jgi:hypothetical protein
VKFNGIRPVDPRSGPSGFGIVAVIRRQYLWGIVLIVIGLIIGPGGISIFV